MTTPPTPAGWYPDPEQSGGLRYWDGSSWTDHRTPAQAPPAHAAPEHPDDQPAFAREPAQLPGTERVGAHRAPEPPEPGTEQPTVQVPLREPAPEPTPEPTPVPPTEQPTTKMPFREPAPYADATTPTPAEPPAVEPPPGTEPPAPVDNSKLVMWFGGAVAALLLVWVLVAVYVFVIHKNDTVQISAPTTTKPSATTTEEETTTSAEATATESPTGTAPVASDGPLEFTVTGQESATTITDPTNEFLTKDAQGEFIVVRLTVRNTSPDPATFVGTFQKLKAAGTVYSIDDEASFYVGGGPAEIPPGGQVDVGVAYDVPPGTVPESIELHADPTSPGVELPV